jgi:hypothetical protein
MERIPYLEAAALGEEIETLGDTRRVVEVLERVALYQSRMSRDLAQMRRELMMLRQERRQRALETEPPQPEAAPPVIVRPRLASRTPHARPAQRRDAAQPRVKSAQFFGVKSAEERQAEADAHAKAYLARRDAEMQKEKTIQEGAKD